MGEDFFPWTGFRSQIKQDERGNPLIFGMYREVHDLLLTYEKWYPIGSMWKSSVDPTDDNTYEFKGFQIAFDGERVVWIAHLESQGVKIALSKDDFERSFRQPKAANAPAQG